MVIICIVMSNVCYVVVVVISNLIKVKIGYVRLGGKVKRPLGHNFCQTHLSCLLVASRWQSLLAKIEKLVHSLH